MSINASFFSLKKYPIAIFCLTFILSACSGGGSGNDPADTIAPTATVTTNAPAAPDPALVTDNTTITVTFSESMDTGTLQLSSDLAGESDGGMWSMTTVSNDTLTISPTSTWSASPGRTLTVNARDLAGNPLAILQLSYDVYRGTLYYVSANAVDDSMDGTSPATAKQTIMAAVTSASVPSTVLVESGVYNVAVGGFARVILVEGVSLYGGYNGTFSNRTPGGSLIVDGSTYPTTGTNPDFAMLGNTGITSATVVDGFTIHGSSLSSNVYTSAVRLLNGASPVLQNNTINGGSGSTASYGIHNVSSASPTIKENTIGGGDGGQSFGIYVTGTSSPTIQGNSIDGGNGGSTSCALSIPGSSPMIDNNTIHGGSANISVAIDLGSSSSTPIVRNNTIYGGEGTTSSTAISMAPLSFTTINPYIDNNIIFAQGGTGSSCIVESSPVGSSSANPSSLRNNDLYNCAVVYTDVENGCPGNADGDNNSNTCTLAEMNALTDISGGVSGNVSTDPQFVNSAGDDWHFSTGSPASVTAGGLNGRDQIAAWPFTTDKDGVTRPGSGNPWGIGAYEP